MVEELKESPPVSVVVVNLNGKEWLEKAIPSVLASDYPKVELIVVDNGSTDGSVEFLRENYPSTRVIVLEKNIGWSPANNEGIKTAGGRVIACLSNDMIVDSRWLKEIVKLMVSNSKIGIVQCNSLSMWDKRTLDSSMNYLDRFGYSYAYAPQNRPQEVFFAEGMAFAFKKEVVEEIGMLDDYYFMEYDDMDFSWRARLAGYSAYFLPSAVVYHARGGTVGRTYFQRTKNVELYTRNHLVTLIKNYETKNLLTALPVVLAIELAKILYLVLKGNLMVALAASRGLLRVLRDVRIILVKRREIERIRRDRDSTMMKIMHPFNPRLQLLFLAFQAKGERLILNCKPPIKVF